jgi:hypothetical protein
MTKAITLSREAEQELRSLAHSVTLKKDMAAITGSRHNPFITAGIVDADAYVLFVSAFNEFINHEPKPFVPMIDKDMRL